MALRSAVREGLHRCGVDIIRYPGRLPGARRVQLLDHYGVTVVIDVGANDGGYARELREFGYTGRIVSFEPLGDAYDHLSEAASRDDRWTAIQSAVGDTTGRVVMNVAGNSTSSSVLPMLETHEKSAPTSRYVGTEDVPIVRLDDVWGDHTATSDVTFLKVDTQGFERQVLDGALRSLSSSVGVQLEMSFVPLYEGAMLFQEAMERLTTTTFELVSLEPGFSDPSSGRMLQADGVFMRRSGPTLT